MQKTKFIRDKKYLAFIRTEQCCICGNHHDIEAHHVFTGGMGIKCNDTDTVPLCSICHLSVHNKHGKSGNWTPEKLTFMLEHYRSKYLKRGKND